MIMFRKLNPKCILIQNESKASLIDSDSVLSDGTVTFKKSDYVDVVNSLPTYEEYTLESLIASGSALQEVPSIIIGGGTQSLVVPDSAVEEFSNYLDENVIVPDSSN